MKIEKYFVGSNLFNLFTSFNPLSMYLRDVQNYALKQILCSFVIGILEFAKKGEKKYVCLSVCLKVRKFFHAIS